MEHPADARGDAHAMSQPMLYPIESVSGESHHLSKLSNFCVPSVEIFGFGLLESQRK